jgi:hypothetical protein
VRDIPKIEILAQPLNIKCFCRHGEMGERGGVLILYGFAVRVMLLHLEPPGVDVNS